MGRRLWNEWRVMWKHHQVRVWPKLVESLRPKGGLANGLLKESG